MGERAQEIGLLMGDEQPVPLANGTRRTRSCWRRPQSKRDGDPTEVDPEEEEEEELDDSKPLDAITPLPTPPVVPAREAETDEIFVAEEEPEAEADTDGVQGYELEEEEEETYEEDKPFEDEEEEPPYNENPPEDDY